MALIHVAGMASLWTETRAIRGVTVHGLYRRPAGHLSSHTSPAGVGGARSSLLVEPVQADQYDIAAPGRLGKGGLETRAGIARQPGRTRVVPLDGEQCAGAAQALDVT